MIKLITIEGFERSGKDSLFSSIKNKIPDLNFYHQPTSESTGVSYRDTKNFQVVLKKHFEKMLKQLSQYDGNKLPIILTRFLISDNIYSDIFNRDHILENMIFNKKCFVIHPFVLLWKTYDEYLKRVKMSNSQIEYSNEEFQRIQEKFIENCQKYNGFYMLISNETPRNEIFKNFQDFYNKIV